MFKLKPRTAYLLIDCREFAVTGDLLERLQHNTALVHGGRQTKLSVSERFFLRLATFAQILLTHPLVSSQVASSSSLTLRVIVELHKSCTSRGMASDLAVLTVYRVLVCNSNVTGMILRRDNDHLLARHVIFGTNEIRF